jgi:hypothetical protein
MVHAPPARPPPPHTHIYTHTSLCLPHAPALAC